MSVHEAVRLAESVLPGTAAPDSEPDPRWQAIIAVGDYVESHPREVWAFVEKWGRHKDDDLRMAIATCLLEHLLEHHFEALFSRVEAVAKTDSLFRETLSHCWKLGQSCDPANARRLDQVCRRRTGQPRRTPPRS